MEVRAGSNLRLRLSGVSHFLVIVLTTLALFATEGVSHATPREIKRESSFAAPTIPDFVLGLDISRYQHHGSLPIDFNVMHQQGISFVYINGGNSLPQPDLIAAKYFLQDRSAAQAAGILTGFYYFAHMPNTRSHTLLLRNADNQANKVVARLTANGAANSLDLPMALDLETLCPRASLSNSCSSQVSKQVLQIWVQEFSRRISRALGYMPVIYSYTSFVNRNLSTIESLGKQPLWIASAGISPSAHPAGPIDQQSCARNPWVLSGCRLNWSIWQYSSGASGRKYGLHEGSVDIDVMQRTFLPAAPGTDTSTVSAQ